MTRSAQAPSNISLLRKWASRRMPSFDAKRREAPLRASMRATNRCSPRPSVPSKARVEYRRARLSCVPLAGDAGVEAVADLPAGVVVRAEEQHDVADQAPTGGHLHAQDQPLTFILREHSGMSPLSSGVRGCSRLDALLSPARTEQVRELLEPLVEPIVGACVGTLELEPTDDRPALLAVDGGDDVWRFGSEQNPFHPTIDRTLSSSCQRHSRTGRGRF